ncbi:MAG: hypothetical protein ABSE62_06085 [Chthoniobacteraceae bacterium]|jgi:hypothetical protein
MDVGLALKHEMTAFTISANRPRLLLAGGLIALFAILGWLAMRPGALREAQPPPQPGFVSRSAHFTLTSEIHVGS